MAFLFSPKVRAFSDESLESYLLRVVAENFFDSYQQLSLAVREELHTLDFDAHGAFPIELKLLNVYHAKHNSHFRMRALVLLESLLSLPKYELQKLALFRSDRTFLGSTTAVFRNGADIPLSFIRYEGEDGISSIPICPHCLIESAYIRQIWHLKPYDVCAKHECNLIHECPCCNKPINYIENESITNCACDFKLTNAISPDCRSASLLLSRYLINPDLDSKNQLLNIASASHRFAALLWYQRRYAKLKNFAFSQAVSYFDTWPQVFFNELEKITDGAEYKLLDLFNKTSFCFIYGNIILDSKCLTPEEVTSHFIYNSVIDYIINLVERNPKSKKPNIADMLVSVAEVAVILSTSHEQVYRLSQDGILTSAFRQKLTHRINPHTGIFYLREVIT